MPQALAPVRRALALAVTALLVALAVIVVPPPAQACGCGGFVTDGDSHVRVQQEAAAISWDGRTERIVMSLSALSGAGDAGLLVPTPAPASVDLAEPEVFDELEELIAPEVQVEYHWWPRGDDALSGAVDGSGEVQVLEQVDLGPVEASVLNAAEPDALAAWLDDHGYVMDDELASAVSPYVTEGWYYVAVRLTSAGQLTGTLPPLDISFESSAVVYPMRMSAAATGAQQIRTYVFADQRMTRADSTASGTEVDLRYAGRPDAEEVTNPTVRQMLDDGPYLTVMDQTFHSPGTQIVSDFVFERSRNGGDYREVVVEDRLVTIAGLPAGPTVLVLGVLAAGLGAAVLAWRRNARAQAGAGRPQVDEPVAVKS